MKMKSNELKNKKNKSYFSAYNILLIIIGLLCFSAILAPILMALGLEGPAKYIYFIYSFFCHQIHYRSLHVFEHQFAWCTRDTFIWFGMLFTGISLKYIHFKGLKWYHIILLPIGMDGGIQLFATLAGVTGNNEGIFYASTNFTRMLTGSLLGIGVGLWVFPTIRDMDGEKIVSKFKTGLIKTIFIILSFLFLLYLSFLGLWYITSTEYRPLNVIDHSNRFPEDKDEWFIRRQNGTCPVDARDGTFFDLNCESNQK